MPGLEQAVIREPGAESAHDYRQRVHRLAAAYVVLFVGSAIGVALLVWQGRLFVSLTQHSNVETLTLAFLMIFFLYLIVLSTPGALGALRIAYYDALLPRLGTSAEEVERRKHAALGPPRNGPPTAALNVILERNGQPGETFCLPVGDAVGEMGEISVDAAGVTHLPKRRDGSNDVLAFFVHQVNRALKQRGERAEVDVVAWQKIDDEATQQYLSTVHFACRLERHLKADELWPKLILTEVDLKEVERRLAAVCPALRSEGFLPDWEYAAEHKLPLVPEPLGLISLSRSERRADPFASMGCAAIVVVGTVAVLALFVFFPPWVPGL
jgi:hypothetical protein